MYREEWVKNGWFLSRARLTALIMFNSVGVPGNAFFDGETAKLPCVFGESKGVKSPAKGGFSQRHLDRQQQ